MSSIENFFSVIQELETAIAETGKLIEKKRSLFEQKGINDHQLKELLVASTSHHGRQDVLGYFGHSNY